MKRRCVLLGLATIAAVSCHGLYAQETAFYTPEQQIDGTLGTAASALDDATPANYIPWTPTDVVTATAELSPASRELVENHFHSAAKEFIFSRDKKAIEELTAGLAIDPDHLHSKQLLQKILERQQQQEQQQQGEQQQGQQSQNDDEATPTPGEQSSQAAAATPTQGKGEQQSQEAGDSQATPTPHDGGEEQYTARDMSPEEAERLLDQLAREEAERRRQEAERRRAARVQVDKDW